MIISVMSIMELSIAAVGVLGALAGCIHGSKCTRIKIGCTGCECERDVPPPSDVENPETRADASENRRRNRDPV